MHVGWICVKHGLAKNAPRLYARQIAVALEFTALVDRKYALPYPPVASTHRVARVALDLPGDQVADDDAARAAVDDDEVEHLAAREDPHRARLHLPHQRLVGAEQQLLAGLAARVERARDLRAAERAVVEQPAVLARERHALRDALVDDVHAQLRQAVDVRLARAVVAALDRVVEEPLDAVAVVLVVLGGVDARPAPRCGARAAGCPGCRSSARCSPSSPSVAAADAPARPVPTTMTVYLRRLAGFTSFELELVAVPLVGERAVGDARVEPRSAPRLGAAVTRRHDLPPVKNTHSGMKTKPAPISDGEDLAGQQHARRVARLVARRATRTRSRSRARGGSRAAPGRPRRTTTYSGLLEELD